MTYFVNGPYCLLGVPIYSTLEFTVYITTLPYCTELSKVYSVYSNLEFTVYITTLLECTLLSLVNNVLQYRQARLSLIE